MGALFYFLTMKSFKVVCVNDKGRPAKFNGEWIQKDSVYTVVDVKLLMNQRMATGFKLSEISIHKDCPYQFFLSNRFVPYDDLDADKWTEEVLEDLFHEETYVNAL